MSVAQPIPTAETARLAGDPNALPAIAGIEPDRVAQPLRQDRAFFLRLLATFMVECAGLVEEVRHDLEAGEPAGAIGRLHRLRGNAGNLGAWAIMALAARLETAIQDGASGAELRDDLDSLEHQLAALGAASAQWRPPADRLDQQAGLELAPTGALDPDQLQRLREALASNNARARQLFKTLEPAFRSLLGDEVTATIGRAIRDLRFDEALVALGRRFPGAGSDR
jgi:HPt (histidine-containing phosphotransfer) domain-containing protein